MGVEMEVFVCLLLMLMGRGCDSKTIGQNVVMCLMRRRAGKEGESTTVNSKPNSVISVQAQTAKRQVFE